MSTEAPATDPRRHIAPLPFEGDADRAMRAVLAVLARRPRLRVRERDALSVHAVARSRWLGIPTDLEVRVDPGIVHLRVATPVPVRERAGCRAQATELLRLIDRELRAD